jgi:hypothetical protein
MKRNKVFKKLKQVNINTKHVHIIFSYYAKEIKVKVDPYLIETECQYKKHAVNSVRKIICIYCDTHTRHILGIYTVQKKCCVF